MENIAVIDDDSIQLVFMEKILKDIGFSIHCFDDPIQFLNAFKPGMFDLVISDVNMPGMNGLEMLKVVRRQDEIVPLMVITVAEDFQTIISHFKVGIWDYLVKPVDPDTLKHRVNSALRESNMKREVDLVRKEQDLVKMEYDSLVHWRNLYALKDINQTKQMISLFTRSVNASGGYVWLDLFKSIPKDEDGNIPVDPSLYNIILESAGKQRESFDFLTFISELDTIKPKTITIETKELLHTMVSYAREELVPLIQESGRSLSFNYNEGGLEGSLPVDLDFLKDILLEMSINAIKHSPEESRIIINFSYGNVRNLLSGDVQRSMSSDSCLVFTFRNEPKVLQQKDKAGYALLGVPHDYSELIFDLFYTMESFPTHHPMEKWSDGTGLFVARSLIKKINGWIDFRNIIDHSGDKAIANIQFMAMLPFGGNQQG